MSENTAPQTTTLLERKAEQFRNELIRMHAQADTDSATLADRDVAIVDEIGSFLSKLMEEVRGLKLGSWLTSHTADYNIRDLVTMATFTFGIPPDVNAKSPNRSKFKVTFYQQNFQLDDSQPFPRDMDILFDKIATLVAQSFAPHPVRDASRLKQKS